MILTAIRRPSGGTRTERLAELANTASYRTVLALAALSLIDVGDGGSGVGWGARPGSRCYMLNLYAEVVADRVRHGAVHDPTKSRGGGRLTSRSMTASSAALAGHDVGCERLGPPRRWRLEDVPQDAGLAMMTELEPDEE
jgi:hypothetical protein